MGTIVRRECQGVLPKRLLGFEDRDAEPGLPVARAWAIGAVPREDCLPAESAR